MPSEGEKRMKKKLLSVFLAAAVGMSFAGCSGGGEDGGKEEVTVPENSIVLNISAESNGRRMKGFGAECDPLFISENVGESGTDENGAAWECKEEDWANVIEPRIEEINLQRMRVMLCPSYFCPTYEQYASENYAWASEEMSSVYQVLETAQKLDITVNLTYWGVDALKCPWLAASQEGWMSFPKAEYEEAFCEMFADAVKYLKEDRGYTCIREITIFNEPNSYGFENYARICRMMNEKFIEAGLRDGVEFNLSDTAENKDWLERCAKELSDISDFLNAHTYSFGYGMTNREIYEACLDWVSRMEGCGQDLYFNEFGTNKATSSHTASDNFNPERGLEICRIAANMVNAGIVGASYWVLFSQLYNREEVGRYMDMGLWGCANEGYACRPVFYAYTLLTRFVPAGAHIYPISSADENIVAFAVRTPSGKWSYVAVNNSDEAKKLAFRNAGEAPEGSVKKYVYDVKNVPTDNRVITAYTEIGFEQEYLFDELGGQSVAVYTQL